MFCRQCGAALGWMLDADFDTREVRATWKEIILGDS
jgi:hypothetical protein